MIHCRNDYFCFEVEFKENKKSVIIAWVCSRNNYLGVCEGTFFFTPPPTEYDLSLVPQPTEPNW